MNYTDDKFDRVFMSQMAAQRGTELHKFAMDAIRLGVRLPETPVTTMGLYVNDAIGFRMSPEVTLAYSMNAFGHVDCISFRNMVLRIHDLKTGVMETGERQLEIYTALFFLEYLLKPQDVEINLRVYQANQIREWSPDPDVIHHYMDRIKVFDKRIDELREEMN